MPQPKPPKPFRPDLTADDIAIELGGAYPGIPAGYISVKGYLGPEVDGVHRIYLDNSFWRWLEVRADDIKYRVNIENNDRDPRDVFWVLRTAAVLSCRIDRAHEIESEIWGEADGDPGGWRRPPY